MGPLRNNWAEAFLSSSCEREGECAWESIERKKKGIE